jgi:hypothetical protein
MLSWGGVEDGGGNDGANGAWSSEFFKIDSTLL